MLHDVAVSSVVIINKDTIVTLNAFILFPLFLMDFSVKIKSAPTKVSAPKNAGLQLSPNKNNNDLDITPQGSCGVLVFTENQQLPKIEKRVQDPL